jgi:hypothetical protein
MYGRGYLHIRKSLQGGNPLGGLTLTSDPLARETD